MKIKDILSKDITSEQKLALGQVLNLSIPELILNKEQELTDKNYKKYKKKDSTNEINNYTNYKINSNKEEKEEKENITKKNNEKELTEKIEIYKKIENKSFIQKPRYQISQNLNKDLEIEQKLTIGQKYIRENNNNNIIKERVINDKDKDVIIDNSPLL